MLKNGICVFMVALVCFSVTASADTISYVAVAVAARLDSDYNSSLNQLTWSGPGDGLIVTLDQYGMPTEHTITSFEIVSADNNGILFSDMEDISENDVPEAVFSSSNIWTINMKNGSTTLVSLTGTLLGSYEEVGDQANANHLTGECWVRIMSSTVNIPYVEAWDSDNINGWSSSTTLSQETYPDGISDYQSDWDSDNLTLVIYPDQSNVVPEPMTLMLLGLGATTLIRRRRSA